MQVYGNFEWFAPYRCIVWVGNTMTPEKNRGYWREWLERTATLQMLMQKVLVYMCVCGKVKAHACSKFDAFGIFVVGSFSIFFRGMSSKHAIPCSILVE